MNGLNEITILAIVIVLLSVVCFYLYTRLTYTEKKMGLIENMLLDIKMTFDSQGREEPDYVPEPEGAAKPLESKEVDTLPGEAEVPEEDNFYNNVLEQVHSKDVAAPAAPAATAADKTETKVSVNYESMTKAELTNLCKTRGLKTSARPGRADLIAALRKSDGGVVDEPTGVSLTNEIFPLSGTVTDNSGFHLELGTETSD